MSPELDSSSASASTSPSPSLLPTPISASFSSSNRSLSGVSSISSRSASSNTSSGTRSISGSTGRRRGYVRPQGVSFAPSAQNRESVLSLGSIAHLQYYFARTGLLDGKGGQHAKTKQSGEYDIPKLALSDSREMIESPIEAEGQLLWEAMQEDGEDVMLPPTVSTYSHRSHYVPPPPDQNSLKRELVEALENALQALESCEKIANDPSETPSQGFYEIQGLQILDTTTLAIRAARLYYTLHPNPRRLNSIRPDHQIRRELYGVLDVLKKCAARNFTGGFREDERLAILVWVSEIGMIIDQETKLEEAEKNERKDWRWMDDAKWIGDTAGRELNFLNFLLREASPVQTLTSKSITRSPLSADSADFLHQLADGKMLIRMHNVAVKRSKRQFGEIEHFHADVAKPYRRADNLRFWLKAAELRWEVKLRLDVLGVANAVNANNQSNGASLPIWATFETTVRAWANGVRTELTKDWNGDEERKMHARVKSLVLASPLGSPAKSKPATMAPHSEESLLEGEE